MRLGTRGSALALAQARWVADRWDGPVEIVTITTSGDRGAPLADKSQWVSELERALLDGEIDVAVHSAKDVPAELADGLELIAIPTREDPRDAICGAASLEQLVSGARVGTSSLRRAAQLRAAREDLELIEIRGNVDTRLRKLDEGAYDALVLAEAGLDRLGFADRMTVRLMPPDVFPAVGQGALGLECRDDDERTLALLERLSDAATFASVIAERQVLSRLRAGCHAPVGVSVKVDEDTMTLEAVVLSADGTQRLESGQSGRLAEPLELGESVADDLLRQGAALLIEDAARS
jgi:hydroxymethylbilane synthase